MQWDLAARGTVVGCVIGLIGGPISTAPNGPTIKRFPTGPASSTPAQVKAEAILFANSDYTDYSRFFLSPPNSLMIKTGLWIELEAVIGFTVGLGLASLLGQRTIAVVMTIVLEIIVTPIFARARIAHFENLQRAVVGLATADLEPGALRLALGGAPRHRLVVRIDDGRRPCHCRLAGRLDRPWRVEDDDEGRLRNAARRRRRLFGTPGHEMLRLRVDDSITSPMCLEDAARVM